MVRAQFLDSPQSLLIRRFWRRDLSAPSTDRVNCTFNRPHPVKPPSIPGCRLWVEGTPSRLGTLPSVLLGMSNRYFFPSNLPKCLIRKLYSCIVVFRSFSQKFRLVTSENEHEVPQDQSLVTCVENGPTVFRLPFLIRLFLGSYRGSADQLLAIFPPLSLETVPEIFAKVNSAQFSSCFLRGELEGGMGPIRENTHVNRK